MQSLDNTINPDDHYRYYLCKPVNNKLWECFKINFDLSATAKSNEKIITMYKVIPDVLDQYKITSELTGVEVKIK
jgi:hypothetical protein